MITKVLAFWSDVFLEEGFHIKRQITYSGYSIFDSPLNRPAQAEPAERSRRMWKAINYLVVLLSRVGGRGSPFLRVIVILMISDFLA